VGVHGLRHRRVSVRRLPAPLHARPSPPVQHSTASVTHHPPLDHLLTTLVRYGIAGLKTLARKKFAHQLDAHLASEELPEACQEAYESTVDSDRGLRDVIIQTFRSHPELSLRKDVEMAVRETPGLAFELFKMASGLPVVS
jgi:hypothetical protein